MQKLLKTQDCTSRSDRLKAQSIEIALVAIDARVEAYPMLAAGVLEGAKVVIIDPDKDGVGQITTALSYCQATSLHVVCHG